MRRKLRLGEGSAIAFAGTEDGILIPPRDGLTVQALNRSEKTLSEQGISLDELIKSGREIRGEVVGEDTSYDTV